MSTPFRFSFLAGVILLGAAMAGGATPAHAAQSPFVLGRVEAKAASPSVRPLLRAALQEELAAANAGGTVLRKRYTLSAVLLKLESAARTDSVSSTCVVSILVKTQQDLLVAVIRGRATAQDEPGNALDARDASVKAAVRSAVSRVVPALRANDSAS